MKEPDKVLDEYLVTRAQAGSREAFERLARRWTPGLLRFAMRNIGQQETARDIVQETWVAAIRSLGRLNDAARFRSWIYGIARRKCIDVIRSSQARRNLAGRLQGESQAENAVPAAAPGVVDESGLGKALDRLGHEQREVVALYYGEDLAIDEIAAIISVPAGTVKSRLFHAREFLKKQLGD